MRFLVKYLVLALLAVGSPALAGDYLVIANGASRDLSVIRLTDNKLLGKVPVSDTGYLDDVTATPDGQILFANMQFKSGEDVRFADSGAIVAIDTRTGQKLWTTNLPGKTDHITTSADGSSLFVPMADRLYIEILDTRTGASLGKLWALWGTHTTMLSKDGKSLYVGSILTGQIFVFDVASRRQIRTLAFSGGEFGGIGVRTFDISADDRTIYSQLSGFHGIAVMDTATNKVVHYVRHGDLPKGFEYPPQFPYNVDHGIALSPDGKLLVASSEATQKAYVYTVDGLKLLKAIPVGRLSKWVVFSRDGAYAYVSNAGDSNVSVISMRSLSEVARVASGGVGGARIKVFGIPDANLPGLLGER
jgi:DNA-binding beta-propeller fold protein YncE